MRSPKITGLGEPAAFGKQVLFQPPKVIRKLEEQKSSPVKKPKNGKLEDATYKGIKRVHVTVDLPRETLEVIQTIQSKHRLRTGKVLPMWKAISQVIEKSVSADNKRHFTA